MEKIFSFWSRHRYAICTLFVFAAGVIVRTAFPDTPGGLNQDEARAAYEAFSLANYGIDTHGYANPVYFVSWGSGMNVLYSYVLIPFVKLFGLSAQVARLPQLIGGILSMPLAFLILRRCCGKKAALIGLAVVAVAPWHIMMSRWGLESNFVVVFLLSGVYFLLRGLERPPFFMLSAAFFGLSLYCYSIAWLFVPLFLLLTVLYCIRTGRLRLSFSAVLSAVILMLLAAPLVLFLLVNTGFMSEIKTPFFSVPLLSSMRSGEFVSSFGDLSVSLSNLGKLLLTQNDGLSWNSIPAFGMYYLFALPPALIGAFCGAKALLAAFRQREFQGAALLFLWLLSSLIVSALLIDPNINRINILHMPMLFSCALGICRLVEKWRRALPAVLALLYTLSFAAFSGVYFNTYAHEIAPTFRSGYERIADCIVSRAPSNAPVVCDSSVEPMLLLFYLQYPAPAFVNTVVYTNAPSPWLHIGSFGRFIFDGSMENPSRDTVYILQRSDALAFRDFGFTVEYCTAELAVAWFE